jgi:DNA-binding IclR family transcriptional regulator
VRVNVAGILPVRAGPAARIHCVYRTRTTVAVLSALDAERWLFESQVVARTLIHTSTVAKILQRLEGAGLVDSFSENVKEAPGWGVSRTRRRYFRLTPAGVELRREWHP